MRLFIKPKQLHRHRKQNLWFPKGRSGGGAMNKEFKTQTYTPTSGASQVFQMVKDPPGNLRGRGSIPVVGKIPWRRARPPTPVSLPGESPGQRSLAGSVHGVAESRTRLSDKHAHPSACVCWRYALTRAYACVRVCVRIRTEQVLCLCV